MTTLLFALGLAVIATVAWFVSAPLLAGRAALEAVLRSPPDVMLVDLALPEMNGVELCMILRGTKRATNTQIVAVSGSAGDKDAELLRRLGIADFVRKNVSLAGDLGEVLKRIAVRHAKTTSMSAR